MRKVFVCHTAAKGPISRAIRWITGDSVSHSLVIYWNDLAECLMIIESSSATMGVISRPAYRRLEYLKESLYVVHELDIGADKVVGFLRNMLRYQGSKYDYGLNASWLLRLTWNRMRGKDTRPMFNSKSRFNCSEAIASALKESSPKAKFLPADVVPGELMDKSIEMGLTKVADKEELIERIERDLERCAG